MGFKEYCRNCDSIEREKNNNFNDQEKQNVEEIFEKYKDKSEGELMEELFKNIEKQKNDGTFNYEGLISTIEKVSPFLSKEQNLKLNEILKNVK